MNKKMTSLLLALLVLAACLPALAQGVSSQERRLAPAACVERL